MGPLYQFKALLLPWGVRGLETWGVDGSPWHDGDTCNVLISQGMRGYWLGHVRCAGMNSPEVHGPTKQAGLLAQAYANTLAPAGTVVHLDSLAFQDADEEDDFGRVLADMTLPDGRDFAEVMIAGGYAVVYEP